MAAVDDAPAALGPLEVPRAACLSLEAPLEGGREFSKPRHVMIAATPVLRERELAKMAALNAATTSWYEDPSRSVRALIDQAFDNLLDLSAATNR